MRVFRGEGPEERGHPGRRGAGGARRRAGEADPPRVGPRERFREEGGARVDDGD